MKTRFIECMVAVLLPFAVATLPTYALADVPVPPTADANGPYILCPQTQPWFLDGTGSVNPDEGLSEPGQPGDTIQEYAWELNGDNAFDDASGSQPDVTAFFAALGKGEYLIQLLVTDTTETSFPLSGFDDLSDTDSTQVAVKDAADQVCDCVNDLYATPEGNGVRLGWSNGDADHYYNIYRGTTSGGPFSLIGSVASGTTTYLDSNVIADTTYYYVIREVALNGDELCQSNGASATPGLNKVSVTIDVKPGSDLNCFNINGHGVIPVAIFGDEDFDVTEVELTSLSFGGLEVRVRGNKGPLCSIDYSDDDPYLDLICHFEDDPEMWVPGDAEVTLIGNLIDGMPIEGADSICIVP